jgi:hypothetical protein
VQLIYPDYKAVSINMERLRKLGVEKGLELPEPPTLVPAVSAEEEELSSLYKQAVQLYKDKQYDDAGVKFEAVRKIRAGYRSTQAYFDSINELKDIEAKKTETKAKVEAQAAVEREVIEREQAREGAQVKPREVYKVEAKKVVARKVEPKKVEKNSPVEVREKSDGVSSREEAQAIAKLSARSSTIYRQIKSLSEDKKLSDTSRTFAKVDRLIEELDAEHRRMVEQVAREKKADAIHGREAKLAQCDRIIER